jgi:spermidine synthase
MPAQATVPPAPVKPALLEVAPTPLALAAILFLLSGAGALVVETTWLRWLRSLLGASAPAVSATLVAFMSGQALGAALASRWARRARRPLVWYGVLEGLAAAACLAVPVLLELFRSALDPVTDSLRTTPALLTAARFAIALAATLPAALCFGASLPLLARATIAAPERLGQGAALLYGINTAGAALGVVLASFFLPDWIGVSWGHGAGVSLLATAGLVAYVIGRGHAPLAPRGGPEQRVAPPARRLRTLAAVSGLASFAAQVLLVQAFARVLNQSTYAFATVLIVTLLALAIGALVVWAVERSGRMPPVSVLGWSLVAAALAFAAFPTVFVGATDGLTYLGTEQPWPDYLWRSFGLAAVCAGPALLASAVVFPALLAMAGHDAERNAAEPGSLVGTLLAWNTGGALVGALVAPYVLLPALGLWLALSALGILYGAAAVFLVGAPPGGSRLLRDIALGLGWMAVMSRGSPLELPPLRVEEGARLLASEQSAAGLVAVLERDGIRRLQIDNHYSLGGSGGTVRQERQGHLPLLLHPAPERVAFLGSATGSSAGAALLHPSVRENTLVEIVPGVARAAERYFDAENQGVYRSGRSHIVLDDARNFLRATRESYDVIVADLFVPWRAGTGSLYTRQHFEAARKRLAPGGLFCQWLPLYQLSREEVLVIAATFSDVFPDAFAMRGDFFATHPILALVGGAALPTPEQSRQRAEALAAAGIEDRWLTHPLGLFSLYLAPLGPSAQTWQAIPRNTDDRPEIEFLAARTHAGARGKQVALVGLDYSDFAKSLRESAADAGALDDLPGAARRAGDGGHALQVAGALFNTGGRAQASQALATAAELLPPELLSEAAPDPSAAEAWRDTGP